MYEPEFDTFPQPEPETELPKYTRPKRKPTKCWIMAANRGGNKSIMQVNRHVEFEYFLALKKIKALYATIGEHVFEMDTRRDSTYNSTTMHQFTCKSLYFELECNHHDLYQVNVHYDNCPFEAQIEELLRGYPFQERRSAITRLPPISTIFSGLDKLFDPSCFCTLKVDAD